MQSLLLENANIIAPGQNAENISISIDHGKISESVGKIAPGAEVLDLSNITLYAGFIDVHNHGAVGIDCNNANSDELHEVSKFLAKNGVTSWLPTLVPDSSENYQKSIDAIDELMQTQDAREPAARVLGVHYEGPFVSEKQCGALRVRYFRDFTKGDEISSLPKLKTAEARHLITLAPEIPGGIELIKKLTAGGWVVSIGHTRAEVETLDAACAAGARHLTHFFNAMTGLHHRNLGVVGWALTNEEMGFDIIADNIHVHPQIVELAVKTKGPEKVTLISDSVSPTGLGDGRFEIWGEKISVVKGKTQNERGSIAGSVITVLDAVKNLLSLGFSASEVSQMAAANPAKLLGIESETGTIEVGKRADLVAVDAAGNVKLTIIGGRIAHFPKD